MINNIADVKGFKCWGAHIGIKSKRRDLAIILSSVPANAAAANHLTALGAVSGFANAASPLANHILA